MHRYFLIGMVLSLVVLLTRVAVAEEQVYLPLVSNQGDDVNGAVEPSISAVANQTISLTGGQTLTVNCVGSRLTFARILNSNGARDMTKGYLTCVAAAPTPTRTSTPLPPTTTPAPPTATPTTVAPPTNTPPPQPTSTHPTGGFPVVLVSRQIPSNGSVYYTETGALPGVGPYTRFAVAAPGKLLVREPNGTLRTLIDGSKPTAASFNLVDVNAPDVSYDGSSIVFAGLSSGNYQAGPMTNPGAWRIYHIRVDGSGLRQITFSDQDNLDLSQFGNVAAQFRPYDDTDPAWMPDGRIVFSSTRWPSYGMYGAARTSNLYVVNVDGSALHRITSERNGADRPLIDPITGKIVYARWWRNFRVATNSTQTILDPTTGGYIMHDGLLAINHSGQEGEEVGGVYNLERNAWHLASVNPDGTALAQWAGRSNTTYGGQDANHAYGGAFAPDGTLYANFFPMANLTEAAGYGGVRRYQRGPNGYQPIIGITTRDEAYYGLVRQSPPSYGVQKGAYAAEPEVLPDGRLLLSWAPDVRQDYGLYVANADGSNLALLYDQPNTTEVRARLIRPRPLPPILPDQVTTVASLAPPLAQGPYDRDGAFTFDALNVYFNAPVDSNIMSAIPVGSASSIRFFIDHQRDQQGGSHESLDWPILLQELPVNPDGSLQAISPANVPLFEQIRTAKPDFTVPLTGRTLPVHEKSGAAHVAGLNFGRPGEVQRCVGCHAGHSMIPVPANPQDAQWSNLAPGALVTGSSLDSHLKNSVGYNGVIDRRVHVNLGPVNHHKYWRSASGQPANQQWLQLTFPVPVAVRTVRLYNLPAAETLQVNNTTIKLYSDAGATIEVASQSSGSLSEYGTDIGFGDVRARVVRIYINSVSADVAGLAEVEVIARGEAGP
jgi:hypothetical protein